MRTGAAAMRAFRRRLGWPIVALCACAGVQLLLAKVFAEFSLSDGWLTMTGAAMMLATIAAYVMAIVRTYATK